MNELEFQEPSPDEARAALAEASRQKQRAQQIYAGFSGAVFIVWGVIYATAYGTGYFWPQAEAVWLPLVLLGFLLSFWLGSRMGAFLRSSTGRSLRNLWAGFGLAYFLLSWGFSVVETPDYLFSFVVNLFIAYALLASSTATNQARLARAGAVLALVNTVFFIGAPSWYGLAMAGLGLLAVRLGITMVRNHEV